MLCRTWLVGVRIEEVRWCRAMVCLGHHARIGLLIVRDKQRRVELRFAWRGWEDGEVGLAEVRRQVVSVLLEAIVLAAKRGVVCFQLIGESLVQLRGLSEAGLERLGRGLLVAQEAVRVGGVSVVVGLRRRELLRGVYKAETDSKWRGTSVVRIRKRRSRRRVGVLYMRLLM